MRSPKGGLANLSGRQFRAQLSHCIFSGLLKLAKDITFLLLDDRTSCAMRYLCDNSIFSQHPKKKNKCHVPNQCMDP